VLKTFLSIIGGLCVLVVMLFVGIAVFSISSKNESQTKTISSADNSDTAAIPTISISAPKLFLDYQANEVRADNIYKGRRLAVRGVVAEIRKDFLNNIVIALASPNQFETVDAHLVSAESSQAAALHKWATIDLECNGAGMIVGSPQLNDCSFKVDSNPDPSTTSAISQSDNRESGSQASSDCEFNSATPVSVDDVSDLASRNPDLRRACTIVGSCELLAVACNSYNGATKWDVFVPGSSGGRFVYVGGDGPTLTAASQDFLRSASEKEDGNPAPIVRQPAQN
jgi:hypothetical protein